MFFVVSIFIERVVTHWHSMIVEMFLVKLLMKGSVHVRNMNSTIIAFGVQSQFLHIIATADLMCLWLWLDVLINRRPLSVASHSIA